MVAPNGAAHLVIGIAIWLCFPHLNLLGILVGSLLPDCDIKYAPAGKVLPLWLFGVKHRGWTHTTWGLLVFSGLGCCYSVAFALALGVGYFLHLLADSTTPSGIRWF